MQDRVKGAATEPGGFHQFKAIPLPARILSKCLKHGQQGLGDTFWHTLILHSRRAFRHTLGSRAMGPSRTGASGARVLLLRKPVARRALRCAHWHALHRIPLTGRAVSRAISHRRRLGHTAAASAPEVRFARSTGFRPCSEDCSQPRQASSSLCTASEMRPLRCWTLITARRLTPGKRRRRPPETVENVRLIRRAAGLDAAQRSADPQRQSRDAVQEDQCPSRREWHRVGRQLALQAGGAAERAQADRRDRHRRLPR